MAETPLSLDEFAATAEDMIDDASGVAIAAGVLSLGWVAYTLVRKYAAGAGPKGGRSLDSEMDPRDSDVPW